MTPLRFLILLLGPLPIILGSIGVTSWFRGDRTHGPANNLVLADEPTSSDPATKAVLPHDSRAAEARLNSYLQVECATTGERLRNALGDECAVIVRPPFIVAGDLSSEQLGEWHDRTVAPATRALTRSYFRKSPTMPVTVLLFSGEASYNHYAKALFGDENVSVYGYYQPRRRTLVMNISTGGGTLVHELTHALIDFDFPAVPDWFNEGLASLYEQCRFLPDDRGLEGLPNWRLAGLQEAVRQGRLGSMERLMTTDDFRGRNVGLNYAQARYFCLYLQERGLLEEFYRRLRAGTDRDSCGAAAARSLFDAAAWSTLDRDFQAWVLTLEF